MKGYYLSEEMIKRFEKSLKEEERAEGTIEKYLRDIREFSTWLGDRAVTKELTVEWKEHLFGCAPVTINSKLSALNGLFRFLGWDECRIKFLKIQRRTFREQSKELTRDEYVRLKETAKRLGQERLALLIETICSTGIRVSEVQYITMEAARKGRADIILKGKIRTILLPGRLCSKLLKYAKKKKIASGEIFLTRSGRHLSRQQIWRDMKKLCKYAGIEETKVFPHNLRHLFAVSYYKTYKDIIKLADIMGHSSIDTTRIYLISAGKEHARQIEKLGLVS